VAHHLEVFRDLFPRRRALHAMPVRLCWSVSAADCLVLAAGLIRRRSRLRSPRPCGMRPASAVESILWSSGRSRFFFGARKSEMLMGAIRCFKATAYSVELKVLSAQAEVFGRPIFKGWIRRHVDPCFAETCAC
jgi:hypothetical protein